MTLTADRRQCEKIVRARAPFHAQWWDDPRLGTKVGTGLPADHRQLEAFDATVTRFFDCVGDVLPARSKRSCCPRIGVISTDD
jgi:hypothetical protein